MPALRGKARAALPDSAFAYIGPGGKRSLPIHDEAHVRNALARFDRVDFEDEAARDRARTRLLRAATRFGIVPVGFVAGQLRPERRLPTGRVTLLMSDVEDSSALVAALGDEYVRTLSQLRRLHRTTLRRSGGREVDARADEFLAAFAQASAALEAARDIQRSVARHAWPGERPVRVRIGVHTGRPTLTATGYVGIAVNTVARACAAGHGGQILVSQATRAALRDAPVAGDLRSLGSHRLRGIPDEVELFELSSDRGEVFPPLRL
jgi:class 3 adenylate cyclase